MKISIAYNMHLNAMELDLDDASLYEKTIKDLEEMKASLNADIEVDMVIDEIDRTFVAKSRRSGNTFRGEYRKLDSDTICYIYHEIAVMDDVVIYLEEFHGGEPITTDYDETYDGEPDE